MDFFEVANTTRAMRRLKTDPVSDEDLWTILQTAVYAPNGGNLQPARFLVVRDEEAKRKIGEWYLEAWLASYGPRREAMQADPAGARTYNSADHLARNIASVPALIFALMPKTHIQATGVIAGASVYPAVQNLMLAARALGLGTTLTTLHKLHEADVRELLGIADDWETMVMVTVGWPKGNFSKPSRRPVEEVVYWERWRERKARG